MAPDPHAANPDGQPAALAPGQGADAVRQRAELSHRFHQTFGAVVGLLLRNPQTRNMPLAGLEQLVLPGLLSGQVIVAEAQEKSTGDVAPIAFALWATVSEAVDQRLSTDLDKPPRLEPNEWKSGDIPWLIMAAGDPRTIGTLAQQVQHTMLGGRSLKVRVMGEDGKPAVKHFTVGPAPQPGA